MNGGYKMKLKEVLREYLKLKSVDGKAIRQKLRTKLEELSK